MKIRGFLLVQNVNTTPRFLVDLHLQAPKRMDPLSVVV